MKNDLKEDFNSAKTISVQRGKNKLILFWEVLSSLNLRSYLKTFSEKNFEAATETSLEEIRSFGIRFIVTKDGRNFVIFLWSGKVYHDAMMIMLDEMKNKESIPKLNYKQRYDNSSYIVPSRSISPLFPGIWYQGEIATNLFSKTLEAWDQFMKDIKIDKDELFL